MIQPCRHSCCVVVQSSEKHPHRIPYGLGGRGGSGLPPWGNGRFRPAAAALAAAAKNGLNLGAPGGNILKRPDDVGSGGGGGGGKAVEIGLV